MEGRVRYNERAVLANSQTFMRPTSLDDLGGALFKGCHYLGRPGTRSRQAALQSSGLVQEVGSEAKLDCGELLGNHL